MNAARRHFSAEPVLSCVEAPAGAPGADAAPTGALLVLRDGRSSRHVPLAEVLWIESYGNYVRVHTAAGRYLHRCTLKALACALEPHGFWRIHRKLVVNGARVATFRPRRGRRDRAAVVDSGARLPVSRAFPVPPPGRRSA